MKTASGGYCVQYYSIAKQYQRQQKQSQLHTRLQYNFYCLFNDTINIHYKQFE